MNNREKEHSKTYGLMNSTDLAMKNHSSTSSASVDVVTMMYCKICRDYEKYADRECSMFLGTKQFRKDILTTHWKSQSHRRCAERKKLEGTSEASTSIGLAGPLPQLSRHMGKELDIQISKLINTAYFICKEELPFSTYLVSVIQHAVVVL